VQEAQFLFVQFLDATTMNGDADKNRCHVAVIG